MFVRVEALGRDHDRYLLFLAVFVSREGVDRTTDDAGFESGTMFDWDTAWYGQSEVSASL